MRAASRPALSHSTLRRASTRTETSRLAETSDTTVTPNTNAATNRGEKGESNDIFKGIETLVRPSHILLPCCLTFLVCVHIVVAWVAGSIVSLSTEIRIRIPKQHQC